MHRVGRQQDSVWDFLRILIFGGSTALTPEPVDIGREWIRIVPDKPFKAITAGASVQIEVSTAFPPEMGLMDRLKNSEEYFPRGCAIGRLITPSAREVALLSEGIAVNETETWLSLRGTPGIPTDLTYVSVMLRAECAIKDSRVSWRNYRK